MNEKLFKLLGGTPLEPEAGEEVLHDGAANLFRGIESVGGWLWLTSRRLMFHPHKINVQADFKSWPLGEIRSATAVSTLLIIPNGLKIELADGSSLRFVVQGRRTWVDAIARARGSA